MLLAYKNNMNQQQFTDMISKYKATVISLINNLEKRAGHKAGRNSRQTK